MSARISAAVGSGYEPRQTLATAADAARPFADLAAGVQVVAEEFVDFARELSALVVRSPSGQAVAYPVSESVQRDGVCVETTTPAPGLTEEQGIAAELLALAVAQELGVVGVLAVELMGELEEGGVGPRPVMVKGALP